MAFDFSPSAGSKISVTIASTPTLIHGAEAIPEFGPEKGVFETTAIDDTAKKFGGDVPDPGDLTLTGIWDSTDPGQVYMLTSSQTPGATEIFTVDFQKKAGATTAAKAVFSALVLSFKTSATKGGGQKFTSKIKLTGPVVYTAQV
jgi:hypothetical protein